MSDLIPVFTCTNGNYEPEIPQRFECKPAVALVVSNTGEREILAPKSLSKCDQNLKKVSGLDMNGHSIDVLDNNLVLGASSVEDRKDWWFISLANPRSGLLSNKWIRTKVEGQPTPRNHVTFAAGNSLYYFGGDFQSQSKMEDNDWTLIKWLKKDSDENEDPFEPFQKFTSHACSIKIDHMTFLVTGGTHSSSAVSDVFEVDILDRTVQIIGHMNHARTQHACTLISKSISVDGEKTYSRAILITGGVSNTDNRNTIVKKAELFSLDNMESKDLSNEMQSPRFKHSMVQLGEEVLALGGETENGITNLIEIFLFDSNSDFDALISGTWKAHTKELRSSSTSNLAVTTLPKSAVECNKETCQCGLSGESRISGGSVVR